MSLSTHALILFLLQACQSMSKKNLNKKLTKLESADTYRLSLEHVK